MNAALYATLCLAAATAIVAAVGDKRKCTTYVAVGPKGYNGLYNVFIHVFAAIILMNANED